MPRTARNLLPGHFYHLTHRCHNGSFYFRFAVHRIEYRRRLWRASRRFKIRLLNYCLTSNHTHLLLIAGREPSTSLFMRHLEGEFASCYNRRKDRRGAFWSERFDSTLVQDGTHFWNCMRYIDLNMVRAGAVTHPSDWPWCGYQEIAGLRQRYRLLDLAELVRLANRIAAKEFFEWYQVELNKKLEAGNLSREPMWTESIAVGSEEFVRRIAELTRHRKRLEIEEWADGSWYVRDPALYYTRTTNTSGKNRPLRIRP